MRDKKNIKTYKEFDQYYIDGHSLVRTKHPDFHVFRFSELGNRLLDNMGPFKTGYYQFAIGSKLSANVSVFNKNFISEDFSIVVFIPGQVIEWEKTGEWDGYVINVKESFLDLSLISKTVQQGYQFLYDHRPLVYTMPKESYVELSYFYELMLKEYVQLKEENIQLIKNLLQVLFIFIRRIVDNKDAYEQTNSHQLSDFQYIEMAIKFKSFVVKNYLESKLVNFYAEKLNITAAYLNKCVKQTYNRTAKEVINEVLLLHAKTMLQNSDLAIKEIAYQLNFDDYSHFMKFFKTNVGVAPAMYKKNLH